MLFLRRYPSFKHAGAIAPDSISGGADLFPGPQGKGGESEKMYFLERKETYTMPNILGNRSFPVATFRWKIIAKCEEKAPLEQIIKQMDIKTHRITSNIIE